MDWVIGMENKTVWVAYADGELVGITASDREAARRLVQTNYLNLNDEGMVEYDEEGRRCLGYTSVRKAAEKCRLDVETFLVKGVRWLPPKSCWLTRKTFYVILFAKGREEE